MASGEEPMRVLVVTNMYPTADAPVYGMFVAEQVEALRERPDVERVDVLFIDGRKGDREYLRAIRRVREQVRANDYDVLHAHYGLAGLVGVMQRRVPVVVTYHSGDIDWIRWHRWLSRIAARRAAVNVCVAEKDIPTLGQPARHLPCGLDTARFAPRPREAARAEFGVPHGALSLLFPGPRDRPKKMHPRFLEVCAALRARGHQVHDMALEGVERDRVPELLAAADAMVLTSVSEGSPVAVMEALASGLPIVATPAGDVRSMIEGVDRCFVAEFDAEEFATAVEAVVDDGPRAPAPRAAHFEQDRIVEAMVAIFREAMGSLTGRAASPA